MDIERLVASSAVFAGLDRRISPAHLVAGSEAVVWAVCENQLSCLSSSNLCLSGHHGNHWQLGRNSLQILHICRFIAVVSCWIGGPLLPGGE